MPGPVLQPWNDTNATELIRNPGTINTDDYSSGLYTSTGQLASDVRVYNSLEAQAQRDWAARENRANRDFQKKMADTQYQRTVADLRSAGLNPALALSNSISSHAAGSQIAGAVASENLVGADTKSMDRTSKAQMVRSIASAISSAGSLFSDLSKGIQTILKMKG